MTRYISACATEIGTVDVVACNAAPCPDGQFRAVPATVTLRPGQAPPPLTAWTFGAAGCFPLTDTAPVGPTTADITAAFRGLVTPATPHIQPGTGTALVRMPLIAYADAAVDQWTPTLLGVPVTIRAVPIGYAWDFGDGTALLRTTDPGKPYPEHSISHTYTATGAVAIGLTTTYSGRYSLDGGTTWNDIPGVATATSPAIPVTLVEARAHLVG